jgi:taurine dioxygenase
MGFQKIEVKPLTGALGAEVFGPDLSKKLDRQTFDEVHQALLDNLVIFFRDQKITPQEQLRFAKRFGPIHSHPYMKGMEDCPQVLKISRTPDDPRAFGNAWHSDQMFVPTPALGTMLYGVTIPQPGGDTLFANMYDAYDALSPGMKRMLGKVRTWAVGDKFKKFGGEKRADRWKGKATMRAKEPPKGLQTESSHPLVRTHPKTKRKGLYFGNHVQKFMDMSDEESEMLLTFLRKHVIKPEFTCRFRWEEGSLAFWDNRCTQHYAVDDYSGQTRVMTRVTIRGDKPV